MTSSSRFFLFVLSVMYVCSSAYAQQQAHTSFSSASVSGNRAFSQGDTIGTSNIIWSQNHDGVSFQLISKLLPSYETNELHIISLPNIDRRVMQSASTKSITISLPSSALNAADLYFSQTNPLVSSIRVMRGGEIEVRLTSNSWRRKKITNHRDVIVISSQLRREMHRQQQHSQQQHIQPPQRHFQQEILPPQQHQQEVAQAPSSQYDFPVRSMVSNNGTHAPVVKVWSTDIQERRYDRYEDNRVRDENAIVADRYPQDPNPQYSNSQYPNSQFPNSQYQNPQYQEPQRYPQEPEIYAFKNNTQLYGDTIIDNQMPEDTIKEIAEDDALDKLAEESRKVKARFSKEQFDAYLGEAPNISLSKSSLMIVGDEGDSLRVKNQGKKLIKLNFNVSGKEGDLLNFSAKKLIISPGQSASVRIGVKNSESLKNQKTYRVNVLSHVLEGEDKINAASFTVVAKPADRIKKREGATKKSHKRRAKLKKARVQWDRNTKEVVFSNSGNSPSKFTDISICIETRCKKAGDINVLPGKKSVLKAPAEASITLTQIVGENRKKGTIPPVQ